MIKFFEEWKIIPIYLLLIFLGISTYFIHIPNIKAIATGFYLLIFVWIFWGIFRSPKLLKSKKNELINYFCILLLPTATSIMFINAYPIFTFENFILGSIFAFFISLSAAFLIIANYELSTKGTNEFERSKALLNFLVFFIMYSLIFFKNSIFPIISKLLIGLTMDIGMFITCALTLVVLCATLSLLAFTHILTIENKQNKKIMRKNGEYFFSSTILAIISLFLLFSLSIYLKYSSDLTVSHTISSINGYLEASLFASLMILTILSIFYCIVYITKGIYSSSKILNIKWTAD